MIYYRCMIKKIAITLFVLGLFVVLFLNSGVTAYKAMQPSPTLAPTSIPNLSADKLLNLVNDFRASKDLNKLAFDPKLCPLAEKRLQQIYTDFSHNKFEDTSYEYLPSGTIGENLAKDYAIESDTVSRWVSSPSHLKNIVDSRYTNTCIVTGVNGVHNYAVQIFSSF